MKFTNVRLVGFKSFVEPTDFEIREGLTGIVGPNGCGKSNLLEALRWVMGATSAKALRGAGMDAVIFSGTSMRPARNWAEVILTLDNSDRSAPAEYNDCETLEVSRRILRKEDGTQSIYRINSKEVRAKDVQLLFADASTGANSPALVRQGQIAELINAKPQNRRRLLEEAAGITGLHTRRHEAELRLRAAEQNLERLDDVISELETQKGALARQARQATRYRNVSGDIRRAEAMLAYLRWQEAGAARDEAKSGLEELSGLIEETVRVAAAATSAQAEAHEKLDPLRNKETEAAAALHRLSVARENLDDEAERARAELARLEAEIEQITGDIERETHLSTDADAAAERLTGERQTIETANENQASDLDAAIAAKEETLAKQQEAERLFDEKGKEAAQAEARRRSVSESLKTALRRHEKIQEQTNAFTEERDFLAPTPEQARALSEAEARFNAAEEASIRAEGAFQRAEEERQTAEHDEETLRKPLREAERTLTEIAAERDALAKLLAAGDAGDWPALIEEVSVEPGYENALAAALRDDLAASLDEGAPTHWTRTGQTPSADALPFGARALSEFVQAPAQLTRRLAAIGVCESEHAPTLASQLRPGQRLVSIAGDLWRWDGFIARAEARSAAALRLEQRNRHGELVQAHINAETAAKAAETAHQETKTKLQNAQHCEREARTLFVEARRSVDSTRASLNALEREHERAASRINALNENLARLEEDNTETTNNLTQLRDEEAALPNAEELATVVTARRTERDEARARAADAQARHSSLVQEIGARNERLKSLARELETWISRRDAAGERITALKERQQSAVTARNNAAGAPAMLDEKRKSLLDEIAKAEAARNTCADALAAGVETAQQADKALTAAQHEASEAREQRARLEAQAEAAEERVQEAINLARETCEAAPEELLGIAEHKEGADLPERDGVERRLERYKRERENLGGVNLRADEELKEVSTRMEELTVEREDCESAIRKLRTAIGGLNKEARQRLLEAFETVNTNFSSLFTRLFNGGQAELRLIDSDDPLDAGLEIMASPPGKKLTSMSLMSGGEQALTATSLIFAVFMANPAPVCVLDEVDAPLDDANVDRFCSILHEMAAETETRFIIITHHALTMSRMSRLFGVTMIERGVSQLVSVDLSKAEQLVAAE